MGEISTRKPHWLKTKVPVGKQYIGVREIVEKNKLIYLDDSDRTGRGKVEASQNQDNQIISESD